MKLWNKSYILVLSPCLFHLFGIVESARSLQGSKSKSGGKKHAMCKDWSSSGDTRRVDETETAEQIIFINEPSQFQTRIGNPQMHYCEDFESSTVSSVAYCPSPLSSDSLCEQEDGSLVFSSLLPGFSLSVDSNADATVHNRLAVVGFDHPKLPDSSSSTWTNGVGPQQFRDNLIVSFTDRVTVVSLGLVCPRPNSCLDTSITVYGCDGVLAYETIPPLTSGEEIPIGIVLPNNNDNDDSNTIVSIQIYDPEITPAGGELMTNLCFEE